MSDENITLNFVSSKDDIISKQNIHSATSIIDFTSSGSCLIVGDVDKALEAVAKLPELKCTIVSVDTEKDSLEKRLTDDGVAVFIVPNLSIDGYMGAFNALVQREGREASNLAVSIYLENGVFDLVLDLNQSPIVSVALPPLGYYRGHTQDNLASSIQELPDLIGDFEKPKYFNYNASICAHSRSELNGCNACASACATGAITTAGEGVSIDPYLCQGCGSCATVCPSGAMTYAYPKADSAIERTRALLRKGGQRVLVLHSENEQSIADEISSNNDVLTLLVEEVSAFGMDYWASMLSAGVQRILLLTSDDFLEQTQRAVQTQINVFHQLLGGLTVNEPVVRLLHANEFEQQNVSELFKSIEILQGLTTSEFATHNDKRQTIRSAIESVADQLPPTEDTIPMDSPAPFGVIRVDKEKCTLCMACVSVCPAKALLDGQETPALRMIEANCLQCGLCDAACPESAITLQPQYTFDGVEARKIQTLNQEEPFNCIRCQKPFATTKIIQTMFAKLEGHWMFKDEAAKKRLKMCDDCRVKDIFENDKSGIDVHKPENV